MKKIYIQPDIEEIDIEMELMLTVVSAVCCTDCCLFIYTNKHIKAVVCS